MKNPLLRGVSVVIAQKIKKTTMKRHVYYMLICHGG